MRTRLRRVGHITVWIVCGSLLGGLGMTMNASAWPTLDGAPPIVIAHRGASGYRPEHTLAAYALAVEQGADFIEPDLVATKDGHLIARHEPLLDATTDVSRRTEFAKRKTTKHLDGKPVTGFFASDFTLTEIKQLRAVQQNAARSKEYDGRYEIPTFDEILELVARESRTSGRRIGIYIETKHPAFHLSIGLPLEEPLLAALQCYHLDHADAPVFIQSFESANLQHLRTRTKVKLVQLLADDIVQYDSSGSRVAAVRPLHFGDPRGAVLARNLADIAKYADAVGPWKRHILREVGAATLQQTNLIERAHAVGLRVHAYTFRNEPTALAPQYAADPRREYRQFFELGIDGVFTDFPDTAVSAKGEHSKNGEASNSK
jgi:glycerophosphoryl diester phosphodiesterase